MTPTCPLCPTLTYAPHYIGALRITACGDHSEAAIRHVDRYGKESLRTWAPWVAVRGEL